MSTTSNPTLGVTTPFYGGGQVKSPMNVISYVGAPTFKVPLPAMTIDHTNGVFYVATSPGVWVSGGSVGGAINTINGLSPVANNIVIAGTASQLTATSAGHTVTFTLPAAVTAPGSLATTTTLTAGSTLTVTTNATVGGTLGVTGATTVAAISASGAIAGATTLGITGASTLTGAVSCGNTLGVTGAATLSSTLGVTGAATFSSTVATGALTVTGAATVSTTLGVTGAVTLGSTLAAHATTITGALSTTTTVTAGTGVTATTGNITATNGNLVMSHVGNKLVIPASASATCSAGTFTLSGAATTVVACSAVNAGGTSLIFFQPVTLGTVAVASTFTYTQIGSTSFTVTPSASTDTSVVAYLIIN